MSSEKSLRKMLPSVSTRRPSHMSVEGPLSPISTNSDDSDSIAEHFSHEAHENTLTPHLSRTSSTSAIGGVVATQLARTWTGKTTSTTASFNPAFEIDFEKGERANPQNWPTWYKGCVLLMMSYATTCVALYSSSYTSAIPGMMDEWGISELEGVLGVTTYLLGLSCGALVLAPLSEMYGRRPVYLVAMALFVVFVIPCAVAKNMATILTVRFLGAFCAAATISNAPGTVNDIVDEEHRALAFSIWAIGPMNGPVLGPIIGGFVYQYLGWRWTNWVILIISGLAWFFVIIIPETYTPALLRKRAEQRRRETGDDRWFSRYDSKQEFWPLLKVNLSRPLILTVTEPICIFWDVYIALVYGILYLCFVAYPIVFTEIRGWSYAISGLSFVGIGVGCMITIIAEPLIRKMIDSHPHDPETDRPYPEAMVSVVCIAAVLIPAGEIWFAWTCTPNVFWVWPILAGIPFGMGNCAVFIYATNYLVHSYGMYAASALAGNAVLRSVMGATLPLAGNAIYASLGANWAGTLLGLLEAACIPIPFIFYRYGHKIRQKSALIRSMQEDKRRMDARQRRAEERAMRRAEADADAGAAMVAATAVIETVDIEKGKL